MTGRDELSLPFPAGLGDRLPTHTATRFPWDSLGCPGIARSLTLPPKPANILSR